MQVFNFGAGPAMLPPTVMEKVQKDFLNFAGLGVSIIELSHRSPEFVKLLQDTKSLLRKLTKIDDKYEILFVHGGARMQFAAIPLNLMSIGKSGKAFYCETGNFAQLAYKEACLIGNAEVLCSGKENNFDRIPDFPKEVDRGASYIHLTSNNTIYGTTWQKYPDTGEVPLVVDGTSDMLSREIDYSKFGLYYAGLQKNLGPSGLAVVIVRKDLLGNQTKQCPTLLNYEDMAKNDSLTNTTNTFAIYVMKQVLDWVAEQGGVKQVEEVNKAKAKILYDILDESQDFYRPFAHKDHRSIMNVTFNLPSESLQSDFITEANTNGLYALKGHRKVGGIRASIYNGMPKEGVEKLAQFMLSFEKKHR